MKVLFICNQRLNRSPTAEELFRARCETRSAGLYNEEPVTQDDVAWADIIALMEEEQRSELAKRFPKEYLNKRIVCLGIPDVYRYRQPELVSALEARYDAVIKPLL